jgi:hypothetical protein
MDHYHDWYIVLDDPLNNREFPLYFVENCNVGLFYVDM